MNSSITTKRKEQIQEEINKVSLQLKSNCKDYALSCKLIDKLLSLKGQYDIEPTRLHVPEKDVIKEYDNDNIRIVRCKGCIIWQQKGGHIVVVYPTMRAEYEFLEGMLDLKDNYDKLSDDMKAAYDGAYFGYSILSQLPTIMVTNDKWFARASILASWGVARFVKEQHDKLLQEETPIENAEFEAKMEVVDELLKDGKYTDKNA